MKRKTPEYIRKAVKRYNEKFDKILVRLPAGYADLIRKNTGLSCNAYINGLVYADLKKNGFINDTGSTPAE